MKLLEDDATRVLDVRSSKEIAEEESIVEDAIHIDYQMEDFEKSLGELNRDEVYLVTCSGGIRGRGACEVMQKLGFKKIYNLKGGLRAFSGCGT